MLPFVSRTAYNLLAADVAELKQERKLLLDRLAILGLGAPLYAAPASGAETSEEQPAEELVQDPATELLSKLAHFKHRPSRMADVLTRELHRRQAAAPSRTAWIPEQKEKVSAMLTEAEEQGRRQA